MDEQTTQTVKKIVDRLFQTRPADIYFYGYALWRDYNSAKRFLFIIELNGNSEEPFLSVRALGPGISIEAKRGLKNFGPIDKTIDTMLEEVLIKESNLFAK